MVERKTHKLYCIKSEGSPHFDGERYRFEAMNMKKESYKWIPAISDEELMKLGRLSPMIDNIQRETQQLNIS